MPFRMKAAEGGETIFFRESDGMDLQMPCQVGLFTECLVAHGALMCRHVPPGTVKHE